MRMTGIDERTNAEMAAKLQNKLHRMLENMNSYVCGAGCNQGRTSFNP